MFYFFRRFLKLHFILLLLFCISNFNCDKVDELINPNTNELVVENERSWHKYGNSTNEQVLSSYSTGSELFIATNYGVFSIDSMNGSYLYGAIPTSIFSNPVLSQNLCVSSLNDGSHLIFFPLIKNSTNENSSKYVQISDIDDSYSIKFPVLNNIGAINNQQQFLTVVQSETEPTSVIFLFYDYKILEKEQDMYSVEIDTMRTIKATNIGTDLWDTFSINACEDNFFVSISEIATPSQAYNYLIDCDGQMYNLDISSERINKFFIKENTYYCVSFGEDINNIYKSENNGMDWELQTQIQEPFQKVSPVGRVYQVIDSSLITVGIEEHKLHSDRLFTIDMETGERKEIENNGIEGQGISSIAQLGENVYVTTNQGLYFKKLEYFFDEKIVD